MPHVEIDPITVNDPEGEAYRQVKMGAREMMIRELTMNAIEACLQKPPSERDSIRFYARKILGHSADKLAIWNRGGMDLQTLLKFSNINQSIDRSNNNFGRGAKIAAIMSNALGIRFTSCHSGRVLEVTLVADPEEEKVGRIHVADPVEGTSFVRDVTSEYANATAPLNFLNPMLDWTEVVLLGSTVDQNTTKRPYLDYDYLPPSQWLFDAIGMRFFDIPDDVKISLHSKITRHSHGEYWNQLYPMARTVQYADNYSRVPFDGGMIHYILPNADRDENNVRRRIFASNYATKSFGGIVWKNEIHNLHSGANVGTTVLGSKAWPNLALQWGLVNTFKKVCILVEIEDEAARHDIHRKYLLGPDGIEIDPRQYSDVVRANAPRWLIDLERAEEPRERPDEDVQNFLRHLMRELRNLANDEATPQSSNNDNATGPLPHDRRSPTPNPDRVQRPPPGPRDPRSPSPDDVERRARRRERLMDAPEAKWKSGEWFRDHDVSGMAAKFDRPTAHAGSTIYFNEESVSFESLVDAVIAKVGGSFSAPLVHTIAREETKRIFYLVVGTHVVTALALLNAGHDETKVMESLNPLVLTAVSSTIKLTAHHLAAVVKETKRRVIRRSAALEAEAA